MTSLRVEIRVYDPDNEIVIDTLEGRMLIYRLHDLEKEFEHNGINTIIMTEQHLDMELLREYYEMKRKLWAIENDKA